MNLLRYVNSLAVENHYKHICTTSQSCDYCKLWSTIAHNPIVHTWITLQYPSQYNAIN